jgi:hypothetical protein
LADNEEIDLRMWWLNFDQIDLDFQEVEISKIDLKNFVQIIYSYRKDKTQNKSNKPIFMFYLIEKFKLNVSSNHGSCLIEHFQYLFSQKFSQNPHNQSHKSL